MSKFVLAHIGFEQPTDEIMTAWMKWFQDIAAVTVDNIGLQPGKEVTAEGIKDIPFDDQATTGFTIIEVENMDEALKIAQACPSITSIKVQEIRAH